MDVKAVTASETIRPPSRIIRTAFTDIFSQLLHAERATGEICLLIAGRSANPLADVLLNDQTNDERHRAELYESDLARIGDIRPIDPRLSEALDAMRDTTFGAEQSSPPSTSCSKAKR